MTTQMLGKYSVHDTIAKGSFSRVRYCVDTITNVAYALRIIDRQKIEQEGLLDSLKNEITIMKMFNHRSLVTVINMMASTNRIFLVLDIMAGGNMKMKLYNEHFLDEKEAIFYFQQFFSGVEYLHSMGITHGNLRLENILLHTNGTLKITDFSMSTILDQVDNENKSVGDDVDDYVSTISATNISVISRLQVLKNSPQYLAPEIIDDTCSDSKKAEIWSMGIILFGMTTGDLPFGAIERRKSGSPVPARSSFYSFGIPSSSDESATETTKEIMDKILACKKKPYPDWISKPLKVLLSGILVANPHKRYSLYDIKASVWMDGLPGDSELLFDNTSTELTLPPPVKTTERSYFSFIECICDPYSTFTGSSENRKLHNNGSGMDSRSRDSDPVDQVSYKTDSSSSVCAADKSDRGRTGLNGVGSQSYSSRTQNAVYAAQMRRKYFSSEIGSEKEKQAFRDANYYMKEEAKEELQQSEEERDGYGEGEGEQGEGEGDEERGEAERKGGGGGGGGQGMLKGVNGVLNKDLGPNKGPHSGPRTKSAIVA